MTFAAGPGAGGGFVLDWAVRFVPVRLVFGYGDSVRSTCNVAWKPTPDRTTIRSNYRQRMVVLDYRGINCG